MCVYRTDRGDIKHMKIYQKNESTTIMYYLSPTRHFKSVEELISFYERNELGEIFRGYAHILQLYFYIRLLIFND